MVKHSIFRLIPLLLMLAVVNVIADPIPTDEWVSFVGDVFINGEPAPVGTVIDAYDPDGVNCGRDTVAFEGIFGFMPVYRDDDTSPDVDEGAEPGDTITFYILGQPATVDSGTVTWSSNGSIDTVYLSLNATVGLQLVDPPTTQTGSPLDTVRFQVGILNIGTLDDFYGITVTQSKSPEWEIIYPAGEIYNMPDSTAYVWFDVVIPDFPGDPPVDSLDYMVYSKIDTTATVSGQVELNAQVVDVEEDAGETLPGSFALHQNYPNPFNPTTTIAFDLPAKSTVRFEVYNTIGQRVHELNLGSLSSGSHRVDFDASDLGSGVYFYRLVTEYATETKKMVLVR